MCNNRGFGESKINHRDEAENLQNGTKMHPVPLHHGEELWGEGRGWGTWGTPPSAPRFSEHSRDQRALSI